MIGLVMALISKEEKQTTRALRAVKTLFFLVSMLISFLVFSAPVLLLLIADALTPAALLSATLPPGSSISHLLRSYDFTLSLVDIPLISLARSAIIILFYSLCDGPRLSRWPYMGITTICSLSSLVFLSIKASYFFNSLTSLSQIPSASSSSSSRALEVALFVCSAALAVGHTVVAYRISCRERRKLLVYKIDIEAVVSKNGFPVSYSKLLRLERMK